MVLDGHAMIIMKGLHECRLQGALEQQFSGSIDIIKTVRETLTCVPWSFMLHWKENYFSAKNGLSHNVSITRCACD